MKNETISDAPINDVLLNKVVIALSQSFPVRYIICWGMTTECHELISCFANGHKLTQKHFFLLIITNEKTPLEQEIQEQVDQQYQNQQIAITVISHDWAYVNDAIINNSRFFTTICRCGCLLYSSDGPLRQIDYPALDNSEILPTAEQHFNHRYHMAEGFLLAAEHSLDGGYHKHAVFLLQQCIKQACFTLNKVFLDYQPGLHNIVWMLDLCCVLSKTPKAIFTGKTESERLFDLMQSSDTDVRWKDDYQVQSTDAEDLYELVHEFVGLTEAFCKEKIEDYRTLTGSELR